VKRASVAWVVAVLLLIAYEMFAVFNAAPNDTLSEAVWKYGQHPMLAFAAGVLVGHFWWQRKGAVK
jgi:hypothetical protein